MPFNALYLISPASPPNSKQRLIEQCDVVGVVHWEEFTEAPSLICEVRYYRGDN